jgi:hypothetical protein
MMITNMNKETLNGLHGIISQEIVLFLRGYRTEINDRGNPLRWPRDTLYPQKLALLRQQAAVARSA